MPTSRRIGGFTFPEDPNRSCAFVLPMWSAAIDPRVLAVRALTLGDVEGGRPFDARAANTRVVNGAHAQHLMIDLGGEVIRLDVIDGTVSAGPVTLRFDLADDGCLLTQLSAIRAFCEPTPIRRTHVQLARRLLALQAVDARDAGASLRETADILFGPGDWPGDGEHRKSHVRRLLVVGSRMIQCGPRAILNVN